MDTVSQLSRALAAGRSTSVAHTEATLQRIAQRQPQLNAYLHVDAAGARQAALQSDARRAQNQCLGPLDGISFAVKDNIDVAGLPTTAGMATRRGRVATEDAFVVQQLRAAGMVLLGKLNMHEAALGATNDNPHYGRCVNPLRAGFTPGGSSGGSACAVAAELCALALGSDTLGSVRIPAAYCGVVGFKASFGLISTRGSVACGPALDHIGPLVRSLADLALVMPTLAAYDPACVDARRVPAMPAHARPRFVAARDIADFGASAEVVAAYAAAVRALHNAGYEVTEISLAGYAFSKRRRAALLLVEADLLVEHAADWARQPHNFSPELTKLLRYADKQPAVAYAAALREVAGAHAEVARWWQFGDLMLLPTAPQTAFAFDTVVPANQADFTAIASMAGVPALSLPLPCAAGALPVGLQCIAPIGHEATLLALDMKGVVAA